MAKFLLATLALLYLCIGAHAHARYAECDAKASDLKLKVGAPVPKAMGGGEMEASERSLALLSESGAEELLPEKGLRSGTSVQLEVALLRGEQHVCEVEVDGDGADKVKFDNGCTRIANENPMVVEVPKGLKKGAKVTFRCAYSSGPGRGIFVTPDLSFSVFN